MSSSDRVPCPCWPRARRPAEPARRARDRDRIRPASARAAQRAARADATPARTAPRRHPRTNASLPHRTPDPPGAAWSEPISRGLRSAQAASKSTLRSPLRRFTRARRLDAGGLDECGLVSSRGRERHMCGGDFVSLEEAPGLRLFALGVVLVWLSGFSAGLRSRCRSLFPIVAATLRGCGLLSVMRSCWTSRCWCR